MSEGLTLSDFFQQIPPSRTNILHWVNKLSGTGSVKYGKSTGRPPVLQDRTVVVVGFNSLKLLLKGAL